MRVNNYTFGKLFLFISRQRNEYQCIVGELYKTAKIAVERIKTPP